MVVDGWRIKEGGSVWVVRGECSRTRAGKWMFYEALNIYFPSISIGRVF